MALSVIRRNSRVVEPLEVPGPVLPARRAVGARAGEERVALEGVGLSGEDVDGVGLGDVAGGVRGVRGRRRARAQRRQLGLVLLGDGRGARARRRAEVVLEHGARRH